MKNQVALITGASSGIGKAIAKKLVKEGYTIFLHGRNETKLNEIASEIGNKNGKAEVFIADLTKNDERNQFIVNVEEKCSCPDIIINNAGFGYYGYFHQMSRTTIHQMAALMMDSIMEIDYHFIPLMLEKGQGHIIHISSISGALPNQGISMYSAVKAFLDTFATSLYRELRGSGVMISLIRPGAVRTSFFERAENLDHGGKIPGGLISISPDRVAESVWRNIKHPKRVRYVPGWMLITKFWEPFFGWFVDLLGPLLLKGHDD
jgi:uncharacterized protein